MMTHCLVWFRFLTDISLRNWDPFCHSLSIDVSSLVNVCRFEWEGNIEITLIIKMQKVRRVLNSKLGTIPSIMYPSQILEQFPFPLTLAWTTSVFSHRVEQEESKRRATFHRIWSSHAWIHPSPERGTGDHRSRRPEYWPWSASCPS